MIEVTRLNGHPMIVNSDLIKSAEASPDTVLTLIHGDKLMVRESPAEIVERVVAYRARLLAAVSAHSGQHDLHRAVGLASHNPEANKLIAQRGGGPTLVSADGRADTGLPELSH